MTITLDKKETRVICLTSAESRLFVFICVCFVCSSYLQCSYAEVDEGSNPKSRI